MCACVCLCMRTYVGVEIIKIATENGRSGRDYGVVKSFDLSRSTTTPIK